LVASFRCPRQEVRSRRIIRPCAKPICIPMGKGAFAQRQIRCRLALRILPSYQSGHASIMNVTPYTSVPPGAKAWYHGATKSVIFTRNPDTEAAYPSQLFLGTIRLAHMAEYIICLSELSDNHDALYFTFTKNRGCFWGSELCTEFAKEFPSMCMSPGANGFTINHPMDSIAFKLKYC
jgi:hypothetical protein